MANHYKRAKKPATIARKQQRRLKSPRLCPACDGMGMVIEGRYLKSYGRYINFAAPCQRCKPGRVPLVDRKTAAAGGAR